MGKATVEDSLRIDAHYWATPTIRKGAEMLVSLLAQAKARIRAGEALLGTVLAETGLMDMQWIRGADSSPAGSIRWGTLAEDGGEGQVAGRCCCAPSAGAGAATCARPIRGGRAGRAYSLGRRRRESMGGQSLDWLLLLML